MLISLARWALVVALSIAIMLPPIWAISGWAVERAEAQHRASRPKTPAQKDFGFGLRGLEALVIYTAGSFVVLWPLSLWASYRLLRGIGQRRRDQQVTKPSPSVQHADLVVASPQTLGESVPRADSSESADLVPVAAEAGDNRAPAWRTPGPAG